MDYWIVKVDMKDIDKLERHEAEQLIAACKLRIESIDENKKQKDRLEKKNKPQTKGWKHLCM